MTNSYGEKKGTQYPNEDLWGDTLYISLWKWSCKQVVRWLYLLKYNGAHLSFFVNLVSAFSFNALSIIHVLIIHYHLAMMQKCKSYATIFPKYVLFKIVFSQNSFHTVSIKHLYKHNTCPVHLLWMFVNHLTTGWTISGWGIADFLVRAGIQIPPCPNLWLSSPIKS